MTPPNHYREAEGGLSQAQPGSRTVARDLATAQLHAMLAVSDELKRIHKELIVVRDLIGQLAEQGQVTDHYTDAIEQLGADKLDVRIGGIYALERIARDYAPDHQTVMAVLTAFIREHSHDPWSPPGRGGREQKRCPRPDIQAAVTVVGLRDASRDARRIDLARANLADADLGGANLDGANLFRANLTDATLAFATFTGADLTEACLDRANLFRADLTGANLACATLFCAKLDGANLARATLTDADLTGANLDGANLDGAKIDGARWPGDMPAPGGCPDSRRPAR